MNWKTKTHEFTATICQHTGKTCPALARLARAMAGALEQAGPATTAEFEIEGSSELTHCPKGCTARFRARRDHIRVYSGAGAGTSIDALDGYANMIFGTGFTTLPSSAISDRPCAMLEAWAIEPRKTVQIPYQASA